jgi:hypothetical protein
MRFILGIAFPVVILVGGVRPISDESPTKSCAGCYDSDNSCRAACDGLNGPCVVACKNAGRICIRRHCILAH